MLQAGYLPKEIKALPRSNQITTLVPKKSFCFFFAYITVQLSGACSFRIAKTDVSWKRLSLRSAILDSENNLQIFPRFNVEC